MSITSDLTHELDELYRSRGVEISAVVTRSGTPVAWHLPNGMSAEAIATLSATIFGASEVIYTNHGWEKPREVWVEAPGQGAMVTRSLGKKAIMVLMCSRMSRSELDTVAEELENRIREVMQNE